MKKKCIIKPDFVLVPTFYKYKNANSEDKKKANEAFAFFEESDTAEEYILKIYKYLDEVPYYWYFFNKTEKEVANEEGFTGEKPWKVEYKNIIIQGTGEGTFLVTFKK